MNYSLIRLNDSADGPGLRTGVYFSGCQKALEGNACPGCHNSAAWAINSGKPWTAESKQKVLDSLSPAYIKGLSILGGEPLSDFNLDKVLDLAKSAKEVQPEKAIWLWTGYVIDDALSNEKKAEKVKKILKYVDVIIDGPFVQELKDVAIRYRGSTNQRILKVHHKDGTDTPFFEDITENTNLY